MLIAIEVALVAQTLEGLGEPDRRERHCVRWQSREARQRQNGGLGFVEIGEVARADERIRPPRDVGFARRTDLGDGLLDRSGFKRSRHTALPLDLLEQAPGGLAKRIGERLDRTRPRGGIGDAVDIRFLDQDRLRIAGDTAGEGVGKSKACAERQDRNRIGAGSQHNFR